jgi:hypothetical protein
MPLGIARRATTMRGFIRYILLQTRFVAFLDVGWWWAFSTLSAFSLRWYSQNSTTAICSERSFMKYTLTLHEDAVAGDGHSLKSNREDIISLVSKTAFTLSDCTRQ